MQFPLMPLGVEHESLPSFEVLISKVQFPLMPLGVEHGITGPRRLTPSESAISSDAVRR